MEDLEDGRGGRPLEDVALCISSLAMIPSLSASDCLLALLLSALAFRRSAKLVLGLDPFFPPLLVAAEGREDVDDALVFDFALEDEEPVVLVDFLDETEEVPSFPFLSPLL